MSEDFRRKVDELRELAKSFNDAGVIALLECWCPAVRDAR